MFAQQLHVTNVHSDPTFAICTIVHRSKICTRDFIKKNSKPRPHLSISRKLPNLRIANHVGPCSPKTSRRKRNDSGGKKTRQYIVLDEYFDPLDFAPIYPMTGAQILKLVEDDDQFSQANRSIWAISRSGVRGHGFPATPRRTSCVRRGLYHSIYWFCDPLYISLQQTKNRPPTGQTPEPTPCPSTLTVSSYVAMVTCAPT